MRIDLLYDAETSSGFSFIPGQNFIVSAFSLHWAKFTGLNLQQNTQVIMIPNMIHS